MPLPRADGVKITGRITTNTSTQEEVQFVEKKLRFMDQSDFIREAVSRSYAVEKGQYFTVEKLREIIPVILQELQYDERLQNSETSAAKEIVSTKSKIEKPSVSEKFNDSQKEFSPSPEEINPNLADEGQGENQGVIDDILEKITTGKWGI
jgi:Arc/MetJ-type ribon-helix-helix transcriptional regulator